MPLSRIDTFAKDARTTPHLAAVAGSNRQGAGRKNNTVRREGEIKGDPNLAI